MKWKTWTLKSQVICQRSQKVPNFSGSVTLHLFGFIAFSVMDRRSRKDWIRLRSMTLPLRCSFPQQPILINYISVCNERRQSTSFLMTKEWFTATAQELLLIPCKALFHSRYKLRGCSSILFTLFVRLGGSSNSRPSDRGFLLKMTFMNCCLAFLSLVKINHVRGFCFTATNAMSTKT